MSQLDDNELLKLELKYGKVKQLFFKKAGTGEPIWFVIRKPTFSEYATFNKYVINTNPINLPPKYEIEIEVAALLLSSLIIVPDDLDIQYIPPGLIIDSAVQAINLFDFEDPNKLREMYISSIKNAHTIVGAIIQRIIAMYGIDGYTKCKTMNEQEIIDLLVYSEIIHDDLGLFAQVSQMPDMPFIKRGKSHVLDTNALLGLNTPSVEPIQSKNEVRKKNQLINHYKSVGYTDKQIDAILNKKDAENSYTSVENATKSFNKLDLDEEQMSTMNHNEYSELKKQGKIANFEESKDMALTKSKLALQEQIQKDREQYGNTRQKNFTGDLNTLLAEVKLKTRDIG